VQLALFDDVSLTPDTDAAQAFSFGSVLAGVVSLRFDVEAVQSSPSFTGLAEVLFDDSAAIAGATDLSGSGPSVVPLPAGGVLIVTAFAALGAMRLRRGG
jgi:hypothetical protein